MTGMPCSMLLFGTLAFRAVNIPARYVEGYEAVTSDEKRC